MKLTARQRAKVNAALCLIHDNGYDAKPIIKLANELMREVDTRTAYELALNEFVRTEPDLIPAISKAHTLVDASDDATVDQYDAALSEYVTSGDNSSLNALAPMIAEDSLALALKNGEITQEEADIGDVAKALGFEPGPALREAIAAKAEQSGEQSQEPNQPMWQPKVETDLPQLGDGSPANPVNSSQTSLGVGPTGFIARGAQQHWAREGHLSNNGNPVLSGEATQIA
jgi:hypothetical protein